MTEREMVRLKLRRARENGLPLPAYKTDGAACFDLCADLSGWGLKEVTLVTGKAMWIPCGWHFEIPQGFEMQVRGRSGLALCSDVIVHHTGTIDCDYRGEVQVGLLNISDGRFKVQHGMRIAQAKISPVPSVSIEEVAELSATARGANGFGSTGTKP